MFESLLSNPEQITFTVLFVALLIYVMKTNDDREKQYRETIDKLTNHLEVVRDIEEKIDNINNRFSAFKQSIKKEGE